MTDDLKKSYADIRDKVLEIIHTYNAATIEFYWNLGAQAEEATVLGRSDIYGRSLVKKLAEDISKEGAIKIREQTIYKARKFFENIPKDEADRMAKVGCSFRIGERIANQRANSEVYERIMGALQDTPAGSQFSVDDFEAILEEFGIEDADMRRKREKASVSVRYGLCNCTNGALFPTTWPTRNEAQEAQERTNYASEWVIVSIHYDNGKSTKRKRKRRKKGKKS